MPEKTTPEFAGNAYAEIVATLQEKAATQYLATLQQFGRTNKKDVEKYEAGFRDGMRSMLSMLQQVKVITVWKDAAERDAAK